MGDGGVAYAAGERDAAPATAAQAPLRAADLAWLAAVPCATLVVVAIVLFGPALGEAIFPDSKVTFWPRAPVAPEPTEHARYLIALTAPVLLTGAVVVGARHAVELPPRTIAALVLVVQVAAAAFVVLCIVLQHRYVYPLQVIQRVVYFTSTTIVVGAGIALVVACGLASERIRRRAGAAFRESRGRSSLGVGLALLATAIWVMPALNSESTIGNAHPVVVDHVLYWLDEVFAALNGRFPLVDYAAQYGSLWPYPVAATMALLGTTVGVFTVTMSVINVVAMLALFAVCRRVTRSTVAAVLLFLPLLATSFFMMRGPLENRYATVNLFSTFPLRYAGPFLLLWLVARHLDGAAPKAPRWLFLAAGLTVLNNGDFGIPALGATLAALLWSGRRPGLPRLALEAIAGLGAALALVSALTLLTGGSLPHLELLFRLSGVFAIAGFAMEPMLPTLGMSTVVYLTYVAAIGVATARAVERAPDRLMTGLLAWSGVFGLGIGSYFMGRSLPEVLTNMFPAWGLTIALLLTLSVRAIAARPSRRPSIPEAAVLVAFGVMACSLAQAPLPWKEAERLRQGGAKLYQQPLGTPFIALHTRPGEPVALLTGLGHRAAYKLGIVNVTPYASAGAMPTVEQVREMLVELEASGGRKVFLNRREPQWPEIPAMLSSSGYELTADERYGMAEYTRRG